MLITPTATPSASVATMNVRAGPRVVAVAVAALIALAAFVPSAQAEQSVQARFAGLDNGKQDRFGIRQLYWVPAAGGVPGYEFVLGCFDCDGATYDSTGALTNSTALSRIPTSWILRVPENYRRRLVARVPPGELDQTYFQPDLQPLLGDGYAVAVMDHPSPGFSAWDYDKFIQPPFSTSDYRRDYEQAGRVLKRILRDVVRPSKGSYLVSSSRGTLLGGGLLAGSETSPFDGSVLLTGGDGELNLIQSMITSFRTDGLVPLTHLASPYAPFDPAYFIADADPAYFHQALAGTVNPLDYDITQRPADVQAAWQALAYPPHLQGPTIVIQGLHDTTVWPGGTVQYAQDVVAAGSQDNLRLFFFKSMGHAPFDPPNPPNSLRVDAVLALDRWHTDGAEPGPLTAGPPIGETQPGCTAMGFGSNPRACFDAVLGSGF